MVTQCNCGLEPRPLTPIPVYFPLLIWWHTPLVAHSTLSWTHCISVSAEIHISLDDPQDKCPPPRHVIHLSAFSQKAFSDATEAYLAHMQVQSRGCSQGQPSTQREMRRVG